MKPISERFFVSLLKVSVTCVEGGSGKGGGDHLHGNQEQQLYEVAMRAFKLQLSDQCSTYHSAQERVVIMRPIKDGASVSGAASLSSSDEILIDTKQYALVSLRSALGAFQDSASCFLCAKSETIISLLQPYQHGRVLYSTVQYSTSVRAAP